MDQHDFVARYPRLWHLADGDAWDGIVRHGLLSAQRLVELFDPPGRDKLLSERRAASVPLEHPEYGRAVLRDQEALNIDALASCLTPGMTVEGWLRMLNGLVFLFPTEERFLKMRDKYSTDAPVVVLKFRTGELVKEHGDFLRVATINTGYTNRKPVQRGPDTFGRLRPFDAMKWARIQEVVIPNEVPDVLSQLDVAYKRFPDGSEQPLL